MDVAAHKGEAKELALNPLIVGTAKGLNYILQFNRATTLKLEMVLRNAKNPVVKAYGEYALHEVAKLNRLVDVVVNELGFNEDEVDEGEAARVLGPRFIKLSRELHAILDKMSRKIDGEILRRFASVSYMILRLLAVQGMAYAKVVEDVIGSPWAGRALRRTSKDLLQLAAKLKLMKKALTLHETLFH